jgi:hypothetical protein
VTRKVVIDNHCGGCNALVEQAEAIKVSWSTHGYTAFVRFCSMACLAAWSAEVTEWAKDPTV